MKSKSGCLLCGLLLVGCVTFPRWDIGIRIVDTSNYGTKFVSSGKYREVIVGVDEEHDRFYTFRGTARAIAMRTIGFDGRILGTQKLSILYDTYEEKTKYALSPEGKRVAYCDDVAGTISIVDVVTGEDREVLSETLGHRTGTYKILWMSDNELLLVFGAEPTMPAFSNAIVSLKLGSGQVDMLYQGIGFADDNTGFALSPDGRYFAFIDLVGRGSGGRVLRILDLLARNVFEAMPVTEGLALGPLAWSPDGREIAYEAETDRRKTIVVFSRADGRTRTVKTLSDEDVLFSLAFLDKERLVCCWGSLDDAVRSTMSVFDAASGEEERVIVEQSDLNVLPADGGRIILCEVS